MESERLFYVVMSMEAPDIIGSSGERESDPVGLMRVYATEAAALAYSGGRFAVHAIRLKEATQEPRTEPVVPGGPVGSQTEGNPPTEGC